MSKYQLTRDIFNLLIIFQKLIFLLKDKPGSAPPVLYKRKLFLKILPYLRISGTVLQGLN